MQLKEHQIESFRTLYSEKFNAELTKKEALEKGLKLINLIELILLSDLQIGKK